MSSAAFAFPQKSAEAFRTISEVAIELDVPQHVLRFWESRFAQIRPVKRAGGRRYYRPDDIDLLKGIRALLYTDGLTIKGVQKVLKERGLRHVADIGRGGAPAPIVETKVIEKIVYIEKEVVAPVKKPRPGHLRTVPHAMSLPFFEPAEAKAACANEVRALVAEVVREMDIEPASGLPAEEPAAGPLADDMLAAGERERLNDLLNELTGLKARLRAARRRVR